MPKGASRTMKRKLKESTIDELRCCTHLCYMPERFDFALFRASFDSVFSQMQLCFNLYYIRENCDVTEGRTVSSYQKKVLAVFYYG